MRVFRVSPGSPAQEAGLEVFFDFIVEINGAKLDPASQQVFAEKIKESENAAAKMTVYNTRAHSTREVTITPRMWAGNGLLGATVRYDVVDPAENHGIRVLEVFPNSPAAHAGLVPFQDFLLGTAQAVFHDIDELVEVVTSSINQKMSVYVYNADSESVREVILVPNNDWGGDGCIGCDIGTGLLHRIPAPRRLPGASPSVAGEGLVQGLPPPAYPPGVTPQQAVAVMPIVPTMPGVGAAAAVLGSTPGAPGAVPSAMHGSVPGAMSGMLPGAAPVVPGGTPAAPGMLAVPGIQGGFLVPPGGTTAVPGALPAIKPGGSWAPTPAPHGMPPGDGTLPAPPPGMPQSAVPSAAAGAATTAGMRAVAGVTWPPPPGQPAQDDDDAVTPPPPGAGMDGMAQVSPGGLVHSGPSASELPRAPPGTPLNLNDMPPATDISAVQDPSRFGAVSSPEPVPLL